MTDLSPEETALRILGYQRDEAAAAQEAHEALEVLGYTHTPTKEDN